MAQAPAKVNMWSDPVGWLRESAERNAANAGKDELGRQNSPGWLNDTIGALTGATDQGTQEYVTARENQETKATWKPLLESQGLEWQDGMTPASARNTIEDKKDAENKKDIVDAQATQFYSPQAIDERKTRDRRYYDSQQQNAQLRLDTLEAAQRTERREDRRYNERMEMESRKDRRAAMSNLAAGLASLGAAFAL